MAGFRKAERRKSKLRLGLVGPAGSGKTYSALLIAKGLGGKIAVIDSENGSADLYSHVTDYDVCTIEAPYTVKKYLDAINEAEHLGYDTIIIDSLTHAWAGDGGLLDQQGKIADSGKNSFTAWRTVTPQHNKLVESMLTSKCHIIATMRAKTEYVQEKNDKGKTEIKKVGMAPVQRDGMDYEFTVVCDLDVHHNATVSKDRTSLFDGQIFTPGEGTGRQLLEWLESGAEPPAPVAKPSKNVALKEALWNGFLDVCNEQVKEAQEAIIALTNGRGSKEWTDADLIAMEAELKRRRKEPKSDLPPIESARDVDPSIDGQELEDKRSMSAVALSPTEKLKAQLEQALGEIGLGLREDEYPDWLEHNGFPREYSKLTKDQRQQAADRAEAELLRRNS